ncbi:UDP-N-acetylglucosamine 2-epimerase [Latilactobacillus sakei]|uniref:UDP-N-acetylglucosamine 2-epimerase n=1 Tax=Latilactobacillus sakei TaxID=1599 RepID=UPI003F8BDF6C
MKKIALITGSRADYGIMKRLIRKLYSNDEVELCIITTAMHMEAEYGYTYKNIEADGFHIFKKIPLYINGTSSETVISEIAKLSVELSSLYEENKFDLTIILGDRYEMLAAANTSVIYGVPICHIHGGEKTLGNYDEFIRNSITKMSNLHLASTYEYAKRIVQMGESPDRVFNIGAMGVENVLTEDFIGFQDLCTKLDINLSEKDYYVVLFHPVTLESKDNNIHITDNLLSALEEKNCVFIGSNSDTGSREIMDRINSEVESNYKHHLFTSLSTLEYHSLVANSKGLIGNSSSGLIEVPSLGVPTLNIGNRQEGRTRGSSVIDISGLVKKELDVAISELDKIDTFDNPYQKNNSSELAFKEIISFLDNSKGIKKDFFDIDFDVKGLD